VQIEEARRLVEGLGGNGFYVVAGDAITGRAQDRGPLFGKGTVARIGEEIAAARVAMADPDGPPAVVYVCACVCVCVSLYL
jgi:hypothetical protein